MAAFLAAEGSVDREGGFRAFGGGHDDEQQVLLLGAAAQSLDHLIGQVELDEGRALVVLSRALHHELAERNVARDGMAALAADAVIVDRQQRLAVPTTRLARAADLVRQLLEARDARELTRLKVGDILPIDLPKTVPVCVEQVPVFTGEFGISNGNNAVKIIAKHPPGSRLAPVAPTLTALQPAAYQEATP